MGYDSKKECFDGILSVSYTCIEGQFDSERVKYLKEVINYLEKAIKKDSEDAESCYYLGMAYGTLLLIDTSLYNKEDTTDLEKFAKAGIAHLKKAVELQPDEYGIAMMVNDIQRLAWKGGVDLLSDPAAVERRMNLYLEVQEDWFDKEQQNLAKKLKNSATTLLEKCGSLESKGNRVETIAEAIAMLAVVLSINLEDVAANEDMVKACDLLSVECNSRKGGKGKASKSKKKKKK